MPLMLRAMSGASSPAALTTRRQVSVSGAGGAGEAQGVGPADVDLNPLPAGAPGDERRVERETRAGRLRIAEQRQHQMMRIDNAGRRREERARAGERRLEPARVVWREEAQIVDAVRPRARFDRGELAGLKLVRRDDQLAAAFMGHAVAGAEFVKRAFPGDAEARHQAVFGIIDAGMNDLAVARGNAGADRLRRLEDD